LATALTLAVAALTASAPSGAPAATGEKGAVRTDALGDPLPPGVIARLGTERLCHLGAEFLVFSPDDKTLASVDSSGGLRVWDVYTGMELWRFQGERFGGWSLSNVPAAFSPDGKLLAVCCADKTIRVLDAATGQEQYKFDCAAGREQRKSDRTFGLMTQLAISPDGKRLAAGGCGQSVLQWDLDAGKALGEWGDFKMVTSLAYSGDGKSLAALGRHEDERETLCRWDAATGKELVRMSFPTYARYQRTLSPDGTLIAAPTEDGTSVCLLESDTGRELRRCEGETERPSVTFSADGRLLTSNHAGGDIRVWEAATGKARHVFKAPPAWWRSAGLSHDGKRVALTGGRADFAIHIWDATEGKEFHEFPGSRTGWLTVSFSADGKSVYTVSRDGGRATPVREWADWSLRQWDPRTGKELRVTREDLKGEVHWTAFSPDGRRLAMVMHDGRLRLWDVDAGKELCQGKVTTHTGAVTSGGKTERYSCESVNHPAFSADGKTLFAACGPEVHRWDAATGDELPVIKTAAHENSNRCLPAPDGRTVLLTDRNGPRTPLALRDLATGEVVTPVGEVGPAVEGCAFSPDGRTLAVTDNADAGGVVLREVCGGRDRGRLMGKEGFVTEGLAFSPDGRLLAVGGRDSVRLLHLASGREVGRVEGASWVTSVAFSPDGQLLAVGGMSNVALVCDVAAMTRGNLPETAALTEKELDGLWDDLTGADGERAYRAVSRLAESPKESVPFLRGRVKAVPEPDQGRIARLIQDLDDDTFEVRDRASRALERLGPRAEAALRRALEKPTSAEVSARASRLLQKLERPDGPTLPSEELIALRVVEALEGGGTPEARAVLKDLAAGAADAELTQAAKAALGRLAERTAATSP
jgi:WD40 repeat protein